MSVIDPELWAEIEHALDEEPAPIVRLPARTATADATVVEGGVSRSVRFEMRSRWHAPDLGEAIAELRACHVGRVVARRVVWAAGGGR